MGDASFRDDLPKPIPDALQRTLSRRIIQETDQSLPTNGRMLQGDYISSIEDPAQVLLAPRCHQPLARRRHPAVRA